MSLKEKADYEMNQIKMKHEAEKAKKQHEEDKKNRDFVQVYRNHIEQIADLGAKNATALKLLLFFIKHMDGTNALVVSNVTLQEILGYSKPTICKAIKYLKDNGWLCVLKSGTANVYIVNPEVAWTSYEYQKQYCKFNATVFLSQSENHEYLANKKAFTKFKTINEDFVKAYQENEKKRIKDVKTAIETEVDSDGFEYFDTINNMADEEAIDG